MSLLVVPFELICKILGGYTDLKTIAICRTVCRYLRDAASTGAMKLRVEGLLAKDRPTYYAALMALAATKGLPWLIEMVREAREGPGVRDGEAEARDVDRVSLVRACRAGHAEVVLRLLGFVAVDAPLLFTHLWSACEAGHAEVVGALLDHAEKKNIGKMRLRDAFNRAYERGRTEVIRLLIDRKELDVHKEAGAVFRIAVKHSHSALERACIGGHADVVALLLSQKGIVVSCEMLRSACANGHAEVVEELLKHRPPIDRSMALREVCRSNSSSGVHKRILKLLLSDL